MKAVAAKKQKKVKENEELKETLCDIMNKCSKFVEIDKKMEELVEYCCKTKKDVDFKRDC
jgi:hypothetical protein